MRHSQPLDCGLLGVGDKTHFLSLLIYLSIYRHFLFLSDSFAFVCFLSLPCLDRIPHSLCHLRYFKEIASVRQIVCNDFSEDAVANIRRNLEHNGVSTDDVIPSHADASVLMHTAKLDSLNHYDVIDLDPYGTATPFLDAAVQAVTDGGTCPSFYFRS